MNLTQKEAMKRWCPFARVIPANVDGKDINDLPGVAGHNRLDTTGPKWEPSMTFTSAMMCIGSSCMAWRRGSPAMENPTTGEVSEVEGYGYKQTWLGLRHVERGYCGLSGRSEINR